MFFIKLMLIILLNETFAYVIQSDIETVILPAWKPIGKKKITLTLKAFGKQIELDLYRDDQTTSSAFKVWKHDTKDKTELSQLNTSSFCYYHHNDHISSAVINFCQEYGWEGFVLLENDAMEIKPVQDDFASLTLIDNFCARKETNVSFGKIYRIKRSLQLFANSSFYNINLNNFKQKRQAEDTPKKLTIELAVFFDNAAFRSFISIVNKDNSKLQNMILAYVNNIEALFHHPSLGVPIDISLVYLEIMLAQPSEIPLSNNVNQLFSSFCEYAYSRNYRWDDTNRYHWDAALYLTGLNVYKLFEKGRKEYFSTSMSRQNSVCDKRKIPCAVVEFGPDNTITSGFASSFIAARQIAEVIGIPKDNVGPCENLDHIMATRRLQRGQLTWSQCSRNVSQHLWNKKKCLRDRTTPVSATYFDKNHSQYNHLPGRIWTAKAQCEIYYRDKNANVVSLADICQTLQCETSTQNNFTGPALEGTRCAHEKECQGGRCLPIYKPQYTVVNDYESHVYKEKWSKWIADSCRSSCLERSKGVVVKRRSCTGEIYQTAHCKRPYYDVDLCDDALLCANKSRLTVSDYTKEKCTDFSSRTDGLKLSSLSWLYAEAGHQHSHIPWQPWMACAIFCNTYMHYPDDTKYSEPTAYCATSNLEVAALNMDPYFPDGTWCHRQDGQNYYCRQHYCLPENYSFNSRALV